MTFIKFDSVGTKLTNTISLTKSQSFGFAGGFFQKNNIQDFSYVTLFYDPTEQKVGFQFSKEKLGKSSFSIVTNKGNGDKEQSGGVAARSFFKSFGIDCNKYSGKYEPVEFTDQQFGKMFYIVLKEKQN